MTTAVLQPAQSNRRKSPRRRPRSAVKIECRKGTTGLGNNLIATVLDVSDTGVRAVLTQELAPRAEVEIIITSFSVKETIKRVGVIRWQVKMENGQFCTGIEFHKRLVYRDWQNLASPN